MNDLVMRDSVDGVAVVGMTCRFPGANNLGEFWENLREGVESLSFFSDQEVEAAGVDPVTLGRPDYVKAWGVLEDIEMFAAAFFGYSPREAEIIDPQHRIFLECAWEALESAGYDSCQYKGTIGVFAGTGVSHYLWSNLYPNRDLVGQLGFWQVQIGNGSDYLTTRVSYKLGLTGPSLNIQTACSTSLVAVCLASQSLLNYQCDMALAGGVSIRVPQKAGYLYQEGGILSPDGHCRAFDARGQGTIAGNGVGVVVLRRLEDALADGDTIHAVVKGSAINNDGALKIGYTAPGVDGQADVITMAQILGGVEPDTISYIEAHGTGTALGDPIEIAALTKAFRVRTAKKDFCAIGSVKTNIGHLDAAAGIASLIKTVLALKHKAIPPSLHFEQPNPEIDFASSPFYVNTRLSEWKTDGVPRRAGINAFGIGGTNAHVILEEAPAVESLEESRSVQLLVLSAKTDTALDAATANLARYLRQYSNLNLADVAYTLQIGRRAFGYRRAMVCRNITDAVTVLETLDPERVFTNAQEPREQQIVFMFSGQGAQYIDMGRELYRGEPTFRDHVNLCSELLRPHLGLDLREVLYPNATQIEAATQKLYQTAIAQPALFVIEHALAKLWMAWGIHPQAMIGHSIGEYVAACLAGVLSLEDALKLVANRGQLMQELPKGDMLAVHLPEQEAQSLVDQNLALAAINGPSLCVVSGPTDAIEELESRLARQGIDHRRLHTSHAFHSEMMEPIVNQFAERVAMVTLKPPQIPYVSNVTGTWIRAAEAMDPNYWAGHLRQTVRFAEGMNELLKEPDRVLLEVGPGRTLCTLTRQHPARNDAHLVLSSLHHPQEECSSDVAFLHTTLGRLWLAGVQVNWHRFHAHARRRRVPLPTYPFERQCYWIEPQAKAHGGTGQLVLGKRPDVADWFYIPSWKRSALPEVLCQENPVDQGSSWLVFSDACGLGSRLVAQLEELGCDVTTVTVGTEFARVAGHIYTINPHRGEDYDTLLEALCASNKLPGVIVHLWSVTSVEYVQADIDLFRQAQDLGFYSLLFLAQALGRHGSDDLKIGVVSNNLQEVTGEEALCPEKATVLGACRVIPQEYPNITCQSIDVVVPVSGTLQEKTLIDHLIAELAAGSPDPMVAYRRHHRWVQTFEAIWLNEPLTEKVWLREGGIYLIVGGLGYVGFVVAEYLAREARAKLVLTGRSALPERDEWEQWLATHDAQDDVSRKIRQVQTLENLGAEVLILSADVASQKQMQDVIARTYERFGGINGVVHVAGVIQKKFFRAIQDVDRTGCEAHFQPKVYGLYALDKALQGSDVDFCVLMSSLSSILGGIGNIAYSAANLFMDVFVCKHNRTSSTPWVSINWAGWQPGAERIQHTDLGASLLHLLIMAEEGQQAFERILHRGNAIEQVVVSPGNLFSMINQWVKREPLRGTKHTREAGSLSVHPRPNLQNAYVAPRNETEQMIADICQEILGIEQVGVYDNFFELGGHSLLATQFIARLRDARKVELPLHSFFETPTVASLATAVMQSGGEQEDAQDLDQVLKEIEGLSADEVQAALIHERSFK